jgi:hypothetical protein
MLGGLTNAARLRGKKRPATERDVCFGHCLADILVRGAIGDATCQYDMLDIP